MVPHSWNNISKDALWNSTAGQDTAGYFVERLLFLSPSTLMECMKHLLNAQKKTSAIDSSAVDLVHDLIMRKIKLKMKVIPFTFSTMWDLAHIWGILWVLLLRNFPLVQALPEVLTLHASCRAPAFRDFVVPLLSCVPESRNNNEFTTVISCIMGWQTANILTQSVLKSRHTRKTVSHFTLGKSLWSYIFGPGSLWYSK